MKKLIQALLLSTTIVSAAQLTQAEGKTPWYVGLDLGYAIGLNDAANDFAWSLYGGYKISNNLGIEFGLIGANVYFKTNFSQQFGSRVLVGISSNNFEDFYLNAGVKFDYTINQDFNLTFGGMAGFYLNDFSNIQISPLVGINYNF